MMTVKELKVLLQELNDNVEIYVQADHGQTPYQADYVNYAKETKDLFPYNGEDINFYSTNEMDDRDVTAILIW